MPIRISIALLTIALLPADSWSQQDLTTLSRQLEGESTRLKKEADSIAIELGMPIRVVEADGATFELQKFENGRPFYYITDNAVSAQTISSDEVLPGGGGGYALTGAGITLGEWDAGGVRGTHQEFGGRVLNSQGALHFHSTHVAGTMIAAGVSATRMGMSPQASLRSYDWNSDAAEMASQAGAGLRVSNHSYGNITGWRFNYLNDGLWAWFGTNSVSTVEDYLFGFYDNEAQSWDNIAYNAPNYLIVKSAGNDRDEGPSSSTTHWDWNGGWVSHIGSHSRDGNSGYDCIAGSGISKNILTVGAVNDVAGGYTTPGSVVMSSFSSWGPTDDGRIKPDIVTNGVGLSSTYETSDVAYGSLSGTSMAAPSAAGSIGLLLQHQADLHGATPLLAATMKGIIIHTADEAGGATGPDYRFGWGLMNTLKAVQLMKLDTIHGTGTHITTVSLANGDTAEIALSLTGDDPLRATIVWSESAGPAPPVVLDPTNSNLRNDIDLRIIEPDGNTVHQPWILNPALPTVAAARGDNTRDNLEQVLVDSTDRGIYTLRVTHKGSLVSGPVTVSVIVSGNVASIGPLMVLEPDSVEADVLPYTSTPDSVKLYNTGDTVLIATAAAELSSFWISLTQDSVNIAPGDSAYLTFDIDATSLSQWTTYEGSIEITSNDVVDPMRSVAVRANVLGPTIERSPFAIFIDLDSLEIGYDTLVIRNTGHIPLDVVVSDTSGTYPPWIMVDEDTFTIPVGDSARMGMTFNQNDEPLGDYRTALRLVSNDSATGEVLVPVLLNLGTRTFYPVNVIPKWNLVSLPVDPLDPLKTANYPTAVTDAYKYAGTYAVSDSLKPGQAYWMKFAGAEEIVLDGFTFSIVVVDVEAGWNLIGGISESIPEAAVISDPADALIRKFYRYNGGYIEDDTIQTGLGYWVQANEAASVTLTLPVDAAPKRTVHAAAPVPENLLTIADDRGGKQVLRFGSASAGVKVSALPPAPPEGFDARFATGNGVETLGDGPGSNREVALAVRTEGAILLTFSLVDNLRYSLRDAAGKVYNVRSGESIRVSAAGMGTLGFLLTADSPGLPTAYSLDQNYPNPFNPQTDISFALPEARRVKIVLYNLLGNEVGMIADGEMAAGFHTVSFNAAELPSGVYIYRMSAGAFTASRKMVVLR